MSDIIERHKELSKMVLIPGGHKTSAQKTKGQMQQQAPPQFLYLFLLGAIVGSAIFVTLWVISGFSKLAVALPFVGGGIGVAVEMLRQKKKG